MNNYQRFHNGLHVLNGVILDIDTDIYSETEGIYGWRDLLSSIEPRGGTNSPTWTSFRNGLYAYAFPSTKMTEVFSTYHIDHDYAMGTKVFPHLHFTVNSTVSGTVRIGFEYSVAKGHQQSVGSIFNATTTIYVNIDINGATDRYKHFVAEVSELDAIPSTLLEPDSIVMMRIFRDHTVANNYTGNIFGLQADLHYQVGRLFTKNKSPNFYS